MEETKEAPVEQSQDSSAAEQKSENSPVEDFKRDMFKFKERAKKLEEEKAALMEKLKERELQEEEVRGSKEKALEEWKKQAQEHKKKFEQAHLNFAKNSIRNAVKTEALKRGCKNTEAFIRLMGEDSFDLVSLDDGYNPDKTDVESLVEQNMKKYEDIGLFGKEIRFADKAPTNNVPSAPPKPKSESEILEGFMKSKGW